MWGGLLGIMAYLLYRNIALGVVMTAAMTLNLMLAASAGVLHPADASQLGRRSGARPSGVILTAITDVVGFFIFLGLATLFLV